MAKGIDGTELPPVFEVVAINVYFVLDTAPVKLAGEVVLVVVGPVGLTVNVVVSVPAPVPPVHDKLKLFDVAVGAVDTAKTGCVGGLGRVFTVRAVEAVEEEPAEFFPMTTQEYEVFGVSPVNLAVVPVTVYVPAAGVIVHT